MERIILNLGGIEFTPQEIETAYNDGKRFIVKYKTIWQINYSQAQHMFCAIKIATLPTNWTKRGRFILTDQRNVNNIVEHYKTK